MAQQNQLRAVAYRLNNTPLEELPRHVGYLAASIYSFKQIRAINGNASDSDDIQIHKLNTKITLLLQDRSQEGRFAGIVLAKAVIESFDISLVGESNIWVRSLLSCLNKSDCHEVKTLCLATISRCFILTKNLPSLVREITTPCLPAFISSSLSIVKPLVAELNGVTTRISSPLLHCVLQSWYRLIPEFASTFRPHSGVMKSICLSLIGDAVCHSDVQAAASHLLAVVHFCAPKNTAGTDWAKTCAHGIEAIHEATDYVFRSIIEDWKGNLARNSKLAGKQRTASVLSNTTRDALDMDPWTGVAAGAVRIVRLLGFLKNLITGKQAQMMQVPISSVLNLCSRLSAVTLPTSNFILPTNPDIPRDEREELWLNLPSIHLAVLDLAQSLVETYGQALFPLTRLITTQALDIFESESHVWEVRRMTYSFLASMLKHKLLLISKVDTATVTEILNSCCLDLKREVGIGYDHPKAQSSAARTNNISLEGSMSATKLEYSTSSSRKSGLFEHAWALLPLVFTDIPLHLLHFKVRAMLDSTAILLNHHEAILASVLNPPKPRPRTTSLPPSMLPFLAASDTDSSGKEALLRPRMPLVKADRATRVQAKHGSEEANQNNTDTEMQNEPTTADSIENVTLLDNEAGIASTASGEDLIPLGESTSLADTSTLKRDFASTLEQSVNQQLRTTDNHQQDQDQTADAKRQRLHDVPIATSDPFPSSEAPTNAPAEAVSSAIEMTIDTEISPEVPFAKEDPPASTSVPLHTESAHEGKKPDISDNEGSESDFEMPTIDTAFSSDEEE